VLRGQTRPVENLALLARMGIFGICAKLRPLK
jgi:hypothetical protein